MVTYLTNEPCNIKAHQNHNGKLADDRSEGTLITVLQCLSTAIKGIRFFIICGMQILYQSKLATDHDK